MPPGASRTPGIVAKDTSERRWRCPSARQGLPEAAILAAIGVAHMAWLQINILKLNK